LYFAIIVSPFVGFDVYTSNMKQKKDTAEAMPLVFDEIVASSYLFQ